ncbi:hypothetical protein BH09SUM1_BH09SUM1_28790 [soil metagenome]
MATRYSLLIVLICAALFASSCASRVKNTGTLSDYSQFNCINKKGMKLRLNPEALKAKPATPEEVTGKRPDPANPQHLIPALADDMTTRAIVFVVAEPTWDSAKGFKEPEKEDTIQFTIRERFYRYLLRVYAHPVRVRYNYRKSDPLIQDSRVITLKPHVTDIKRGEGLPRYLLGYGLGQTRLQVEGEIYEGISDPVKIGEFAFRVGHGGYAQNGWNTDVLKDDYCLRYAAEQGILEFTAELPKFLPGVEKLPKQ